MWGRKLRSMLFTWSSSWLDWDSACTWWVLFTAVWAYIDHLLLLCCWGMRACIHLCHMKWDDSVFLGSVTVEMELHSVYPIATAVTNFFLNCWHFVGCPRNKTRHRLAGISQFRSEQLWSFCAVSDFTIRRNSVDKSWGENNNLTLPFFAFPFAEVKTYKIDWKLEMLGSIVWRLAHYDACANLSTLCKHRFF